jgi:hypothetical protein
MPLDFDVLVAWIAITIAFIAVVAVLYTKVSRAKRTDGNKDEAPTH